MVIREIKQQAQERLKNAPCSPRTVALVYAAVTVGTMLVIQILLSLLDLQIADTSGLAGIGTRSIFMSLQLILSGGMMLLSPFWSYGYMRVALQTAQGQATRPDTLLSGFRRFWPLVRFFIVLVLLYPMLFNSCMAIGSILYAMTPHSAAVMARYDAEALMEMMEGGMLDQELILGFAKDIWPSWLLIGLLMILVVGFVTYRLRLADWHIMSGSKRVLHALACSNFSMRGNIFRFVLLDLSFWWYYLLSALPPLCFSIGGMFNSLWLFWGFYLLGSLLQFGILVLFMPKVQTTYALAYTTLFQDPMADQKPPEQE